MLRWMRLGEQAGTAGALRCPLASPKETSEAARHLLPFHVPAQLEAFCAPAPRRCR